MPTAITLGAASAVGFGFVSLKYPPIAPGQQAYTTPGTYTWVAPAGVRSVCVVCVGGGSSGSGTFGSGTGGGLGWKNNISVYPGNSYTVFVGAGGGTASTSTGNDGQDSYFISTGVVAGLKGRSNQPMNAGGGGYVGDGGGNGGNTSAFGGGGGAGGYAGNGGSNGGAASGNAPGSGGAGASGFSDGSGGGGSGGGGVGILGQGASGVNAGEGGSGGGNADASTWNTPGAAYGGGGSSPSGGGPPFAGGAGGAVRIIWAGTRPGDVVRAFPSTNTGDL